MATIRLSIVSVLSLLSFAVSSCKTTQPVGQTGSTLTHAERLELARLSFDAKIVTVHKKGAVIASKKGRRYRVFFAEEPDAELVERYLQQDQGVHLTVVAKGKHAKDGYGCTLFALSADESFSAGVLTLIGSCEIVPLR